MARELFFLSLPSLVVRLPFVGRVVSNFFLFNIISSPPTCVLGLSTLLVLFIIIITLFRVGHE